MKDKEIRLLMICGTLALFGAASEFVLAQGAAQPTPAERAIQYRQAVFKVVAGNFGPLAQKAQGKAELSEAEARNAGARLASIAEFVPDAFPDVSKDGETKAKPEIWANRAEFDKLANDLVTNTKALAAVTAKSGATADEFKAAVGGVGNACKGCHDKFRAK
ncbi:MAG TPA: cytochrome c [Steroidobacteraceae bacterium]|nr:cytochrome c [Steroidobacteraceae bacterium]